MNVQNVSVLFSQSSPSASLPSEPSQNEWQVMKKRKIVDGKSPDQPQVADLPTRNRFQILVAQTSTQSEITTVDDGNGEENADMRERKEPPPPPIFIQGVVNYSAMRQQIDKYIGKDKYYAKAMANNVVKISAREVDDYRKLVRDLRANNVKFYTYQLKSERPYSEENDFFSRTFLQYLTIFLSLQYLEYIHLLSYTK